MMTVMACSLRRSFSPWSGVVTLVIGYVTRRVAPLVTLPGAGLHPGEAAHGQLCMPCVVDVAAELVDPGRMGEAR